jgi:hypothetical protein
MKKRHYFIPTVRLDSEFEYIDILKETSGTLNEFGETVKTIVTTPNIRAFMTPMNNVNSNQLVMFDQGLIKLASHWCMVTTGVTITARNHIVDIDSNNFEVMEVVNYTTHKESLLKKVD